MSGAVCVNLPDDAKIHCRNRQLTNKTRVVKVGIYLLPMQGIICKIIPSEETKEWKTVNWPCTPCSRLNAMPYLYATLLYCFDFLAITVFSKKSWHKRTAFPIGNIIVSVSKSLWENNSNSMF